MKRWNVLVAYCQDGTAVPWLSSTADPAERPIMARAEVVLASDAAACEARAALLAQRLDRAIAQLDRAIEKAPKTSPIAKASAKLRRLIESA